MEKTIGMHLKQYREDARLSVEEVCTTLAAQGYKLSPKTLYGYENDVSSPKISVFVSLCNLYGVKDISGSFGYGKQIEPPELRLSSREREVILAYRANPTAREYVERLLGLSPVAEEFKEA